MLYQLTYFSQYVFFLTFLSVNVIRCSAVILTAILCDFPTLLDCTLTGLYVCMTLLCFFFFFFGQFPDLETTE